MTPLCPTCGGVVEVVTADEGTSSYRPHLLTDEMVERAARELHRLSDDVLPFDLGPPHDPWRSVKLNDTRSALIDRRRERHLTTARAALEAALGNGT